MYQCYFSILKKPNYGHVRPTQRIICCIKISNWTKLQSFRKHSEHFSASVRLSRTLTAVLMPTLWLMMSLYPHVSVTCISFRATWGLIELGGGVLGCRGLWRKWEEGFVRWHRKVERAKGGGRFPDPVLSPPPLSFPIYVTNTYRPYRVPGFILSII